MEEPKPLPESRKRPLQQEIQDTPYYKMRALLRDLRPHFIEVLKTPDFRNCKAAEEIRQGMKLLKELCQELEMTEKSFKLDKCSNGDIAVAKKPEEDQQDVKLADDPLLDDVMAVSPPDRQLQGTYIVGGSAFGWNFITYHSIKAVYYGRTKEAFRAINPKTEVAE